MIRALPLCLALALTACAEFPEVGRAEAALTAPGATPPLLTAEEMSAIVEAPVTDRSGALAADAAALRARAARLRKR